MRERPPLLHLLAVSLLCTLPLLAGVGGLRCARTAPPLVASEPPADASDVGLGSWIALTFASAVRFPQLFDFALRCDGLAGPHRLAVHAAPGNQVVVNPAPNLPPATTCRLSWRGRDAEGPIRAELAFDTAPQGAALAVVHDRADPLRIAPYPDDVFLAPDPATATGWRHQVPELDQTQNHLAVFGGVLAEANLLDGFSPIGPFVVELSDPLEPESLPRTPAESLAPLASAALLDLTPGSDTYGRRVPFRIDVRNGDTTTFGLTSNTLLIFPSLPLEPGGRYGFFLTSRAHAGPGRPLAPSDYFRAVRGFRQAGEDSRISENRALLREVFRAAARLQPVPVPRGDLAFAARISIRSTDSIQEDVLTLKRQILAADPPAVTIDLGDPDTVVDAPATHVAALVRGTWDAPDWRDGVNLARDGSGAPVRTGTRPACFRLALPLAALDGPVPVVMYQHGNPGESETGVLGNARSHLAEAGYAVIGFTDILNREVAPPSGSAGNLCTRYESPTRDDEARITDQVFAVVLELLTNRRIADHWHQTLGEQLAFVRMIRSLGTLDLLPLGAPDGVPDLDPTQLLYMGISEGGNNGQAFVAYAPEVRAAALLVGGARLIEVLIHQQAAAFLESLPLIFPLLTPAEIWTAAALFQADFDRQDKHNHARFAYRQPATVPIVCDDAVRCGDPAWCDTPGHCSAAKPSVLLVEGLDDSLVPNHSTDSAAWQLGPMPHLEPVQRAVPFLETAAGAVTANIAPDTTAAFYQYVPNGVDGIAITPGCKAPPLSERSSNEGHFCAQSAVESRAQRLMFFGTALDPARAAPTIADPLPFYPEGTPLFPLPDPLP